MFARYLAGRFRDTSKTNPKKIDCILVTHGDADHFEGLPEILESETNKLSRKRLFITPERYYHNGIVKRPSTKNNKDVDDLDLPARQRPEPVCRRLCPRREQHLAVAEDRDRGREHGARGGLARRRKRDDAAAFVQTCCPPLMWSSAPVT